MAAGIQFESLVDLEEEVNLAITGPVTIIRSWRSNFPIRSSREFRVFELAAGIRLGHFSAAEQPIRMKVSREEESHLVHTWAHSHQKNRIEDAAGKIANINMTLAVWRKFKGLFKGEERPHYEEIPETR